MDGDPILKYFTFAHLPSDLQMVSEAFCRLAQTMAEALPENEQRHEGLKALLLAKDCFVRAAMDGTKRGPG